MRGRDRADAAAFVVARWPEFHNLALLVDPDPVRAGAVTESSLVDAARQWRDVTAGGRPSATVRADLLARLLAASPDQPESRAEAHLSEATAGSAADGDLEPALRAAWWALSGGERAAYLLSVRDHRTEGEVAAELGMPSADVARLLTCASERLADAQARVGTTPEVDPWSRGSGAHWADPAVEVARMLDGLLDERRAAIAGGGPDSVLTRARTLDRRRRGITVGVGAALVAALAGGALLASGAANAPTPKPSPTARPTPARTPGPGAITWPVRGALASDPRVLAAAEMRNTGQRVLWAEDRGDRRYILTSALSPDPPGTVTDGTGDHPLFVLLETHLLVGSIGTPVSDLADFTVMPARQDPGAFVVVDDTEPADPRLVVVAAPDTETVDLSRTVSIAGDLSLSRTWEPLQLTDGIGVLGLGHPLPALTVRLGTDPYPPSGSAAKEIWGLVPDVPCPDCGVAPEFAGRAGAARAELSQATGVPPEQISVQVAFATALPPEFGLSVQVGGPESTVAPEQARVVILDLRTPSGAVLRSTDVETFIPAGMLNSVRGTTPNATSTADPSDPADLVKRWQRVVTLERVTEDQRDQPIMLPGMSASADDLTMPVHVPASSPTTAMSLAERAGAPDDGRRAPVEAQLAKVAMPMSWDMSTVVLRCWGANGQLLSEQLLYRPNPWNGPFDTFRGVWP